ncbi:MAG TPA: ATP-binding protein [Aggregicoccus sp.]|nr:ATP-binding protein [Aggregicoccus sp.]
MIQEEQADPFWFLADGGETGALARTVDWSRTPLGRPESWPAYLKTTLATLFHSRHPMFLWWGPELIQFYNDAYRPSFGEGKHPAAMGQRGEDCWPEIWPIIGPQIREVMEHGRSSWNEDQLVPIFRNGSIEEVYWTYGYSPVFADDGRVAGTLVVCTETTRQVVSRREIEQAQREAERARRELQGIFMQAPVPMCIVTGPRHVFTLANAPYVELVGQEVVGRAVCEVFSEEVTRFYVPILDRVLETGEPVRVREAPLPVRGADGTVTEHIIDVAYHPYCDDSGASLGVLVAIQDVSISVRSRRQMEALTEELKAALHLRDEFLSIASHELRTPLTGMKLHVQAAKRGLVREGAALQPARVNRLIEQTEHGLGRMTRLVEDMLDISRIQSGKLQLSLQQVDLPRLLQETFERFGAQLSEVGSPASLQLPDALTLDADPLRLEQVVTNLLTNAIRYAPGAPITVRLSAAADRATLSFADEGPGIAPQDQERVFRRFERLSPARHASGLGLGLYIVRENVHAHGGSVSLHSEPGRGTCFTLELPLRGPGDAQGPAAA